MRTDEPMGVTGRKILLFTYVQKLINMYSNKNENYEFIENVVTFAPVIRPSRPSSKSELKRVDKEQKLFLQEAENKTVQAYLQRILDKTILFHFLH